VYIRIHTTSDMHSSRCVCVFCRLAVCAFVLCVRAWHTSLYICPCHILPLLQIMHTHTHTRTSTHTLCRFSFSAALFRSLSPALLLAHSGEDRWLRPKWTVGTINGSRSCYQGMLSSSPVCVEVFVVHIHMYMYTCVYMYVYTYLHIYKYL